MNQFFALLFISLCFPMFCSAQTTSCNHWIVDSSYAQYYQLRINHPAKLRNYTGTPGYHPAFCEAYMDNPEFHIIRVERVRADSIFEKENNVVDFSRETNKLVRVNDTMQVLLSLFYDTGWRQYLHQNIAIMSFTIKDPGDKQWVYAVEVHFNPDIVITNPVARLSKTLKYFSFHNAP